MSVNLDRFWGASICPKSLSDESSQHFAYNPAFNALLTRIGATLK
jgi:hypothetical protein